MHDVKKIENPQNLNFKFNVNIFNEAKMYHGCCRRKASSWNFPWGWKSFSCSLSHVNNLTLFTHLSTNKNYFDPFRPRTKQKPCEKVNHLDSKKRRKKISIINRGGCQDIIQWCCLHFSFFHHYIISIVRIHINNNNINSNNEWYFH